MLLPQSKPPKPLTVCSLFKGNERHARRLGSQFSKRLGVVEGVGPREHRTKEPVSTEHAEQLRMGQARRQDWQQRVLSSYCVMRWSLDEDGNRCNDGSVWLRMSVEVCVYEKGAIVPSLKQGTVCGPQSLPTQLVFVGGIPELATPECRAHAD